MLIRNVQVLLVHHTLLAYLSLLGFEYIQRLELDKASQYFGVNSLSGRALCKSMTFVLS